VSATGIARDLGYLVAVRAIGKRTGKSQKVNITTQVGCCLPMRGFGG